MNLKNMFRVGALMFVVSFLGMNQGFAQISLGPEVAFPVGDFSTGYNTGFGVSVRYDKPFKDQLAWTFTAGYVSFSYKTLSANTSMIPLNAGLKYYFDGTAGWYGAADLGLFFLSTSYAGTTTSETKFGLTPGIGYRMDKFDFAGRYNIVANANYFNIRVAYIFPSK